MGSLQKENKIKTDHLKGHMVQRDTASSTKSRTSTIRVESRVTSRNSGKKRTKIFLRLQSQFPLRVPSPTSHKTLIFCTYIKVLDKIAKNIRNKLNINPNFIQHNIMFVYYHNKKHIDK
jgi:hypothetical protein